MPAAAAKLSQGELAEAAMFNYNGAPPHPLIDIGANLADPAFDQACMLDETLSASACRHATAYSSIAHRGMHACMHAQDRDAVLARAKRAGVEAVIITGSSLRSTARAAELVATHAAPEHPQLYFTAGVHPHEAKSCNDETLPALRGFLAQERCVAVGECGLDFNRRACTVFPSAASWRGEMASFQQD
jgi:TatD DNase family protein